VPEKKISLAALQPLQNQGAKSWCAVRVIRAGTKYPEPGGASDEPQAANGPGVALVTCDESLKTFSSHSYAAPTKNLARAFWGAGVLMGEKAISMNDEQLRALLKKWNDIEPKANFEANVWRRIRLARTEEPGRMTVLELLLKRWLWRPALAVAAAVVVSVIVGSSAGVLSARGTATIAPSELQFLGSGTLAGGYVKAGTGGR